jgi:hypothetical protein
MSEHLNERAQGSQRVPMAVGLGQESRVKRANREDEPSNLGVQITRGSAHDYWQPRVMPPIPITTIIVNSSRGSSAIAAEVVNTRVVGGRGPTAAP